MGKDEVIDSYIDEKGVVRQADLMVGEIQRIHKALLELGKAEISLGKVTGAKELKTLTSEIIAAQTKLAESTAKLTTIEQQLAKAREQENEAKRRGKKGTDESISATEREAKAQLESFRAKKEATKYEATLQKELEKTNKERIKEEERLGRLNNAYEQLKAKYAIAANSAKALAAAKGLDNEETKEAIVVAERYYKELFAIEKAVNQSQRNVGNYTQATFALNQVLREAPAFANSFATGISAISNNVPMLIDEFKRLRVETGSNMTAFRVLLGAFGSFTTILPIAFLLIQSYGKEISAFAKSLFATKDVIDKTKESQAQLNKAFSDIGYADAVKTVKELTINLDLAKKGFISKEAFLKQYNETIGQTTGEVKSLDEAERELIANGDNYVKMMLYKAAANLALEEAAKKSLEAERLRLKNLADYSNALTETRISSGGAGGLGTGQFNAKEYERETARINAAREKRKNDAIKIETDAAKTQEDIARGFLEKAASFSKDFDGVKILGKGTKENNDKELKDFKDNLAKQLEAQRKALAEITRSRIEAERDSALAIAQNEENSFEKRMEGYRTFYDKSLELLRFNTEAEKQSISEKAKEEKRQVNEDLKSKKLTAEQRRDLQATITAIDATAATERLAIEANYNRDVLKLTDTSEKQISDLSKNYLEQREKDRLEAIKKQKDAIAEELAIRQSLLNADKNSELADLNDLLNNNLVTIQQYNAKKKEIEDRYAQLSIDTELEVLETQLTMYGYSAAERAKIIERISALGVERTKSRAEQEIDSLKQIQKAEEELAEKRKQVALELYDALVSVNTARFDREKERNDEEIKLIDQRLEKETNSIKQTATNAVERDRLIAEAEARSAAQKEQLQKKNEEIERKRANFEKAAAITRIAVETALAVLKLKAQAAVYLGAVVTAPLAAIPLSQIPFVIASGAIAAGAIAAKKFKFGKKRHEHYEGIGIVGDGGKSELHIKEDGSMEVTPDVPTYTYVRSKDVILPDAEAALKHGAIEINKTLNYSGFARQDNSLDATKIVEGVNKGINGMRKDVVNAIKNQPQPIIETVNPVRKWVFGNGSWTKL